MAEIRLDHIAHAYMANPVKETDYALRHIDNVWQDGGAYALLGPSGCGKTTLLNIISGLLTPSQGRVFFDDKEVTALPPEQRNIAQVFQFPVLYDTMSVYDNLAFPLRNRGFSKPDVDQRVREVAEILELTPSLGKKAARLSADAKQKISLGRGLVRADVAAILFDEPLTVIDPHLKWQLRCKLKQVHEQLKLTLLYVTHDQVEALTFADKVIVMYEGAIVQIGTPEELFEYPGHKFVGFFIGSPGMNFLPFTLEEGMAVVRNEDQVVAELPLAEASVTAAAKALEQNAKVSLEMGIRPLYVQVWDQPGEHRIPVTVTRVEDQGNFKILTLMPESGDAEIKARVPGDQSLPGERAWMDFPQDKIRLFADEIALGGGHG